jgi:hypothetical protein
MKRILIPLLVALGTDPGRPNAGLTQAASDGAVTRFRHPQNATPAIRCARRFGIPIESPT